MIALGLVLVLIGYLVGIGILYTIGAIFLVVGVILLLLSFAGITVGPSRYYW